MRKNATKIAAMMLSLALTVTSVNVPTTASAASKVKLNKSKATLYVGGASSKKTTTLKATVNGKKVKATFTSNKPKVAKVAKKTGKVTAVKAGTATITAKYKGKKATAKITVKQYVTGINAPAEINLTEGETINLSEQVSVKPANASNKTLNYSPDESYIAGVNKDGSKLKGVKEGTTSITIKAKDGSNKKVTVAVNVKAAPITETPTPSTEPSAEPSTEPTASPAPDATAIKNIVAKDANTITVTFGDDSTADIKLDTALTNGENTISFQYNGKTYTDQKVTYVDKSNVNIKIVDAAARSNNQVTVTLASAPLTELKAGDFSITPALDILSVTTNNNIVSLTTAAQTSGTEYTISAGESSAKFKASDVVVTEGVMDNVKIVDKRNIFVTFKEKVAAASVKLNNTYLRMTDDSNKKADVEAYSLEEILKSKGYTVPTDNWEIVPVGGLVTGVKEYTDYVFRAKKAKAGIPNVTEEESVILSNDTVGLKYNENATLEVRNAKDASGNYVSTSQGSFTYVDTIAPTVATTTTIQHKTDQTPYMVVQFSEAVERFDQNKEMKVYINGVEVEKSMVHGLADNMAVLSTNDIVNTGSVAQHSAFVIDLTGYKEDVDHSIKIVGARDLKGNVQSVNPYEATFRITTNNGTATVNPIVAPKVTAVTQIADNVFNIVFDQKNVAALSSDKTPAIIIENAVVDKKLADEWANLQIYNDNGAWKYKTDDPDSVLLPLDTAQAGDQMAPIKAIIADTNANRANDTLTVVLNATLSTTKVDNSTVQSGAFSYDDSNEIYRNVTVQNFYPSAVTTAALQVNYLNPKYAEKKTFIHDITAPVATAQAYDLQQGVLYVGFKDDPFDGTIKLQHALAEGGITISMTSAANNRSATYFAKLEANDYASLITVPGAIPTTGISGSVVANKCVKIDLAAIAKTAGKEAAKALLTDNYELLENAVYTVTFDKNTVIDTVTDDAGGQEQMVGAVKVSDVLPANAKPNAIVKQAFSISTGTKTTLVTSGAVPQAIPATIVSGQDVLDAASDNSKIYTYSMVVANQSTILDEIKAKLQTQTGTLFAALANSTNYDKVNTPGTLAYMINHPDEVLVIFDTNENGTVADVLETSAINKANYTFNGKALSADADVKFYTNDIAGTTGAATVLTGDSKGKESYTIVKLADGDVDKTGRYTISVQNVTNTTGKKMLPVYDSLSLIDNTAPVAKSIEVFSTTEIDVTFDEEIKLPEATANGDTTHAIKNFTVTVNNNVYSVVSVKVVNKTTLRVKVSSNFTGANASVVLSIANDNNKHMYVTDVSELGNTAKSGITLTCVNK